MRIGWKLKVVYAFLLLQLYCHGCFSLNLEDEGLVLWAFRSRVEIDPYGALQNWDTRDDSPCNWKGVYCVSGRVYILKLRGLSLVGSLEPELNELSHLEALLKLQVKSSHVQEYKHDNLQSAETFILQRVQDVLNIRRHLLQEKRNLPAPHLSRALPHAVTVPDHVGGSFPAVRSSSSNGNKTLPLTEIPPSIPVQSDTSGKQDDKSASKSWEKWIFTVVVPATAFILVVSMIVFIVYRRHAAVISPWKTGLSGQLQKAFKTGVPKLNQAELEAACECFSNIINTYPNCIMFKGTLSSGVEIAVVSTRASLLDWSDQSEIQFRNKIDTASRINHKNFINLLGYCQVEDPFMRMMVFEYAPNGTLFDHLHVTEFEHLQWSSRMRIVMGIAYCLQYMHNLNPPVIHPILQSSSIFITEDYAAKIADIGIFSEPVEKENFYRDDEKDNTIQFANSESNVYSFGILLLEIISGRKPISEEDGLPILNWAADYLKDKKSINSLVDRSLKSIKEDELEALYEVIKACIQDDPKSRPTMKEVAALLREGIEISPQEAAPRLSPLWWAEQEILSIEAS